MRAAVAKYLVIDNYKVYLICMRQRSRGDPNGRGAVVVRPSKKQSVVSAGHTREPTSSGRVHRRNRYLRVSLSIGMYAADTKLGGSDE